MRKILIISCLLLTVTILFASPQDKLSQNWARWRGPEGTGVARHQNPPVTWDENTNIRWKIPLPGMGLATPVVWKEQIFILTAKESDVTVDPEKIEKVKEVVPTWMKIMGANIPKRKKIFSILSYHKKDGHLLWEKELRTAFPHAPTHKTNGWASNSPVTDGKHIFAYFGSNGLYCLDMEGNLIWEKDFGKMTPRASFGEGSSPALYEDRIVINWDHEGDSFISCLNKNTGKEIWRKDRDEPTSWSTPLIVKYRDRTQVIVSATNKTRSYNLDTGDVIWETAGMTLNVIPTPIYANGIIYVASGFRGNAFQAIDLNRAAGDITGSEAIIWEYNEDTPYTPSPLLYNEYLYFLKSNKSQLTCLHVETGKQMYGPEKLKEIKDIYASLMGASNKIYIVGRNGVTYVVKYGPEFEVLAVNKLDDGFDASPVIVDDSIILRGQNNLYYIAKK